MRMKRVVDNPYHLWAHQSQSDARNPGGNRSFNGTTAYSYAAPIGEIVKVGKQTIYLVSLRTWSVTTSRHQSELRSAIPDGATIIYVYNVGTYDSDHRGNIEYYLRQYRECLQQASTARSRKPILIAEADRWLNQAKEYRKLFKVKGVRFPSAKAIGNLEETLKEYASDIRKQQKRDRELAEQAQAERERVLSERLTNWLDGTGTVLYLHGLAYPRLRVSGDTVETTLGANVPLEHVQKLLPIVLRMIAKEQSIKPEATLRLGHYTVNELTADGTLIVGCHRFPRAEVERFAKVLEELPK